MSKLTSRFNFQQAAERLGITTDDLRSLVVEMPRQLPAIYVTQVGYAEPYEYQLLKVDSMGRAFDMSVGGMDGAVHTGFLRIERVALEKFIFEKGLPIIPIGSEVEGRYVNHRELNAPPASAPVVAESATTASVWAVQKPKRYAGYTAPLYRLLSEINCTGRPVPTARDVVEAWRITPPAEIAQVLVDGFDYYDSRGETKAASLDAIRKAIERMTDAR